MPTEGPARPGTLTPDDYAAFGRWMAGLLADAWRDGMRSRPSDAQDAEGRTPPQSGVRPPSVQEQAGGSDTGPEASVPQHGQP